MGTNEAFNAWVRALPARARVFVAVFLTAITVNPAWLLAQTTGTETTLYSFSGGIEGQGPTDLIPYTDGNFYGTASNVVFQITPAGTLTTLHTFCPTCSVDQPKVSGIVVGPDANFYGLTGATSTLGATFFTITSAGAYTALNTAVTGNPAGGAGDASQLVLGADGNFYGATALVSTPGSVFRITPTGTLTTLYSFSATTGPNDTNADGATPEGRLVLGSDGNFYGTTAYGGNFGVGTVFKITSAGTLTSLYSFGAVGSNAGSPGQNLDGFYPVAGLVEGSDGNFYGGTTAGGANGLGTLFKITPAGVLTPLHQFSKATSTTLSLSVNPTSITLGQSATLTWTITGTPESEGGGPLHSLVQAANGNFYGFGGEVESSADTVFQITPAGVYTTIIQASPTAPNGGDPDSLFQIASGNFYGASFYGNDEGATPYGTIFELTLSNGSPSSPCTASTNPATNGWSGPQVASGSVTVTPTATGTFTYILSCTFPAPVFTVGPEDAQLTVTGAATVKPTVTLTANPTSIAAGSTSALTWSSANATSCTAGGAWSGSKALSGTTTETFSTPGTFTYTLACTGAGGTTTASATVAVSAAVAPAPTVTIAVNPSSVSVGQAATLTWSSTHATACTASGAWTGGEALSGTLAVTPTSAGTETFTLTCSGTGGSAHASAVLAAVGAQTAPAATDLSGRAGGGSMQWGSILGLALLLALRNHRARKLLRTVLTSALAALALSGLAGAQSASAPSSDALWQLGFDQPYIGVRLGGADYRDSSSRVESDVLGAGIPGTGISVTSHRFGGAAFAGIPFWGPLSLEAGYVDLGRYPLAISTSSADIPALAETIARKLWPAGQGGTLGLAAPIGVGPRFAIEPRLSLLVYRSKQEVFTPLGTFADDRTGAGLDGGLSLLVRPIPAMYVGAGVDCYLIDGRCSVLMYSGEVSFHFGR
jgi:uncharacterized repeat protein (TIGR03803 family)